MARLFSRAMLRQLLLVRIMLLHVSLLCGPARSEVEDRVTMAAFRLHSSSKVFELTSNLTTPCLNDTDKLFDLQNTSASKLYRNLCDINFIQVFKINHTMLIFSSITNSAENLTFDFQALEQVSLNNPPFDYRLVLRVNLASGSDRLTQLNVSVDSFNYTINLVNNNRSNIVEFLVPEVFSVEHTKRPNIQLAQNIREGILNESYLMLCVDHADHVLSHCEPYVRHTSVECFCWRKDQKGFIIVAIVLGLETLVIISLLLLVYSGGRRFRSSMPEVQYSFILCMPGFGKFDYLVIFRVGPTTDSFDFDNAYIDFQLFGSQSEPIGIPTRFSCKNLPNRFRGEMHLVVSRITPMPRISRIEANHSSESGFIFFHGFSVINIKTEEEEQTGVIKQYIKLEPKRFSPNKDESESIREEAHWLAIAHRFVLDPKETLAIGTLVAAFISLANMVSFRFFRLYHHWNDLSALLPSVSICVAAVTGLSWLLIVFIEQPFKHIIKHNYFKELFLQVSSENGQNSPVRIIHWVLLCFYIIALVLAALTICLSFSLSLIHGALWSGINFITLVLVIGTWLLIDSICITKPQYKRHIPQEENSASQESKSQEPIFIQLVKSGVKYNGLASIEPQLVNPNLESSGNTRVIKNHDRVKSQGQDSKVEVDEASGSSRRSLRKCNTVNRVKSKKRSKGRFAVQASNRE